MKKFLFKFSDYSCYEGKDEAYIEYGKYVKISEKYFYDKNNKEHYKYFKILCNFVRKIKQKNYIEVNLSINEYEEIDNGIDSSYGNKIISRIMDINLDTGEISTKGYIGVLRGLIELEGEKYDVTVEIGSRFDTGEKQLFLRYLLSYIYDINLYEQLNPNADEYDSIWKWLTVIAFKYRLEKALNNGLLKKYKMFENNDDKVKGIIDIGKHIKYNVPFSGKIAYNKKELTYDNEIMHLILHTYDFLNKKFPDKMSKFINKNSKAYETICLIREVSPNYKNENIQSLISKCYMRINHPYYHNYEPLRKICLLILKNKGISFFGGKSSDIVGVIVNISKLWERFLYKIILKEIKEVKVDFQNEIRLELRINNENKEKYTLRADFVIQKEEFKYVLDAKYKIGWEEFILKSKIKHVLDDYRQITNYVYLLNAKWGGVIFPYKEIKQDLSGYQISFNNEKNFYLFGLRIPKDEDDSKRWLGKIKDNINSLTREIKYKIFR
ncbi:5-methylcytosine restriction system component-like protein [Thermosipho africanus H17ap60334]|uniref:5-methylcytosine restriction system component-like protein n=1 Tax=Thermosipho africanus TaxID=2421 RepID=UPI00028EF222|nr:5-methylcytosine restriction system component-like protein [Thermosipho africanus]EKF48490.1 5-methylcytosine restriction system component-like protein [Thermosipho africanus H17ap60334]